MKKHRDDFVIVALAILALLLLLTVTGCSGQSTQIVPYTPMANACAKISAYEWNSAASSFICFDKDGKPIGMVSGTAQSPLDMVTSYANAAILGATIPLAASMLTPAATTVVSGAKK